MAKFKVRLKVQGLELEVEGSREDVPKIAQNVGQQLAGMLQPAAAIVEGQGVPPPILVNPEEKPKTKRKRRTTTSRRSSPLVQATDDAEAVDWKHNPVRWASPQQSWTARQKAVWLLLVVKEAANKNGLSSAAITATFNKHFPEARHIQTRHVTRDLRKAKKESQGPVSEDTRESPTLWILTQAGEKEARELIEQTRNP